MFPWGMYVPGWQVLDSSTVTQIPCRMRTEWREEAGGISLHQTSC